MTKVQFDEQIAACYDETSLDRYRPEVLDPAVDFLAELAGTGAALEFGVGTGRVALPLSARGVPVHGIDISEPMLEQLRGKPTSERVAVTGSIPAPVGSEATSSQDTHGYLGCTRPT